MRLFVAANSRSKLAFCLPMRPRSYKPTHYAPTTQPDRITVPITNLLINTGEHLVLVDTGQSRRGEDTEAITIQQNLQTLGIAGADIDVVIITHGHLDHIGGLTKDDGQLAFSNARYVVSQVEWNFWTSQAGLAVLDAA